jgi:hypothetical protein
MTIDGDMVRSHPGDLNGDDAPCAAAGEEPSGTLLDPGWFDGLVLAKQALDALEAPVAVVSRDGRRGLPQRLGDIEDTAAGVPCLLRACWDVGPLLTARLRPLFECGEVDRPMHRGRQPRLLSCCIAC